MTVTKRGRTSSAALSVVAIAPGRKILAPPKGMPATAADLWREIAASVPRDLFRPGDMPLLEAYCLAHDRKRQIDAAIQKEGIIFDGVVHPGLKVSNEQAALMASLAVKLRICQSSRTRPDAAALKKQAGARPWDDES